MGYVGSMAMYAFAFGEFAVALDAVPETAAFFSLLFDHLYRAEPQTLVAVELLYFERDVIEDEVATIDQRLGTDERLFDDW